MKIKSRKIFAILVIAMMVMSLLPMTAFAAATSISIVDVGPAAAGTRQAMTVTADAPTAAATVVNLSTNSATGKFYDAAVAGNEITSVTIALGATAENFWYEDTKAATHTITATGTSGDAVGSTTATATFNSAGANRFASSADISKTSIIADGTDSATVTVYVFDQFNNPEQGVTPVVAGLRGTTDILSAPAATDANGKTTFTVKSNVAGTTKIGISTGEAGAGDLLGYMQGVTGKTADDAGIVTSFDVTFTAASVKTISVVDDGSTPAANGVSTNEVTITVYDSGNNRVANQTVDISVDKTGAALSKYSGTTNALGQVKTKVSSTKSGTVTITASVGSVSGTGTVTFVVGGAYNIELYSGGDQKVALGYKPSSIKFKASDINGNQITTPVASSEITSANTIFKSKPSDTVFKDGDIGVTDVAGDFAELTFARNIDKAGEYVIQVALANGKTATVSFTAAQQGTVTGATVSYKQNSLINTGKSTEAPSIKLVDADGYGTTEPATNFNWSSSNPSLATVAQATGIVTSVNDSKQTGNVTITAVHKTKHYVVTNEFYIGSVSSGMELTIPETTTVGETATITLQLTDADGNARPFDQAVKAAVTLDVSVASKPDGAVVETSSGSVTAYQDNLTRSGKHDVTVKSDTAGDVTVIIKAYDGVSNYIIKTATLTFGEAVPEDEAPEYGAASLTMFIGANSFVADGTGGTMDVAPFIEDGRTFVPVRFIAEALGAEADWEPKDAVVEVVTLTREDKTITINIGEYTLEVAEADEEEVTTITMDCAAMIKDGRTFLPFRFIAEAFGAEVDYGPEDGPVEWVTFLQ